MHSERVHVAYGFSLSSRLSCVAVLLAKRLLVALVRSDSLVGEPFPHLLGRYVRLLGQQASHGLVRIRIVEILVEPRVERVHYGVGKETVGSTTAIG